MQTTVKLQDMFTYSIIPLIIVGIIVLGIAIYLFKTRKIKPKKSKNKPINNANDVNIPKPKIIKNIYEIKNRYLKQLNNIEKNYKNNKVDLRASYQLISEVIRLFVYEVTDIKTQNYSLSEIRRLNIPQLYELISEFYEPEFASRSVGDFDTSINKARRVISEWR